MGFTIYLGFSCSNALVISQDAGNNSGKANTP
jgi:hypothetical protein